VRKFYDIEEKGGRLGLAAFLQAFFGCIQKTT
jgi:hypothetical protein